MIILRSVVQTEKSVLCFSSFLPGKCLFYLSFRTAGCLSGCFHSLCSTKNMEILPDFGNLLNLNSSGHCISFWFLGVASEWPDQRLNGLTSIRWRMNSTDYWFLFQRSRTAATVVKGVAFEWLFTEWWVCFPRYLSVQASLSSWH